MLLCIHELVHLPVLIEVINNQYVCYIKKINAMD
jgi:hypothetical protein